LHISAYQPKKNVDRIIEAYQAIKEVDKLPLIVIASGYDKIITDSKITLISVAVDRKKVAKYMKEAYAFVFPSLHESFGMPLVEAMACGVPIITSNTTACPEIVENAGVLVNPLSTVELTNAIQQLITNKSLQHKLSELALKRAESFNWQKTARLHETIFLRYCQ